MAITVDSRNAGTSGSGVNSISWTHTVGAGLSNSIVLAQAAGPASGLRNISWDSAGENTIMSREINGSKLQESDGLGAVTAEIWFLRAPSSGAKSIKVLLTGLSLSDLAGVSSSYAGVDQTNSFVRDTTPSVAATSGTNPSITVTTVSGDMVVDAVCTANAAGAALTKGASQTQIGQQAVGAIRVAASDQLTSSTSTTMSWTGLDPTDGSGQIVIAMKPFASTDASVTLAWYKAG